MIVDYYRPGNLEDAISFLKGHENAIPIGGGASVHVEEKNIIIVDLQNLDLDYIHENDDQITIGATTTLEKVYEKFKKNKDFSTAIKIHASKNQREQSTIAGGICSSDGRSPFLTLLLTLDAKLTWQPGNIQISLGEWLAQKNTWKKGVLISEIVIEKMTDFRFESISRSPLDLPIICLGVNRWKSGRLRVCAGGFGVSPMLILDGNIHDDISKAVEFALADTDDQWATGEYRSQAAKVLANRLYNELVQK